MPLTAGGEVMDELVKTFTVPTALAHRRMRLMHAATGTLNARKIGRMRRGQWMMTGFSGEVKDDGTTVVSVRLRKAPPMWNFIIPQGVDALNQRGRDIRRVKMCPYRHDDVGKVLKDLTVAARKWAAHAAPTAAST